MECLSREFSRPHLRSSHTLQQCDERVAGASVWQLSQDHFFVDEHLNNRDSGAKKGAVFTGGALLSNPRADFLHIGQGQGIENDRILQLQVDTKQYGRTFEDPWADSSHCQCMGRATRQG